MRLAQVANTTTGETLAVRAEIAESFYDRFMGLQGRTTLPPGAGLILSPTSSIHMFFMRFSIDAVFVDANWRVTKVGRRLRPWSIGPFAPGALICVELPAGAADRTEPGHALALRPLA
ncbi:MAG TPA: DUF192 domain-containing protein [Ktedonobacterales bacterium]